MQEITPYNPIIARSAASAPKNPESSAIRRSRFRPFSISLWKRWNSILIAGLIALIFSFTALIATDGGDENRVNMMAHRRTSGYWSAGAKAIGGGGVRRAVDFFFFPTPTQSIFFSRETPSPPLPIVFPPPPPLTPNPRPKPPPPTT